MGSCVGLRPPPSCLAKAQQLVQSRGLGLSALRATVGPEWRGAVRQANPAFGTRRRGLAACGTAKCTITTLCRKHDFCKPRTISEIDEKRVNGFSNPR
jgi:hypothetical protein